MNDRALVELTIRYGDGQSKSVAIPISEDLTRELLGQVELSDEPISLLLASIGRPGEALTIRSRAFRMRRDVANEIARAMVPGLMHAFGVNDELDGYRVSDMTDRERAYHKAKGRL